MNTHTKLMEFIKSESRTGRSHLALVKLKSLFLALRWCSIQKNEKKKQPADPYLQVVF